MKQRLYRSIGNKKIGGVCAGLAEYFDIDVALIRVAFVLGVVLHGVGLLGYIILWIAIPENPREFTHPHVASGYPDQTYAEGLSTPSRQKRQGALFAGIALIVAGFYFLLDNLFPWIDLEDYSPVVLIVLGALILAYGFMSQTKEQEHLATPMGSATVSSPPSQESSDENGGLS